jgi:hypothetical protein
MCDRATRRRWGENLASDHRSAPWLGSRWHHSHEVVHRVHVVGAVGVPRSHSPVGLNVRYMRMRTRRREAYAGWVKRKQRCAPVEKEGAESETEREPVDMRYSREEGLA